MSAGSRPTGSESGNAASSDFDHKKTSRAHLECFTAKQDGADAGQYNTRANWRIEGYDMNDKHDHTRFSGVDPSRRVFVRKFAATAFIAPLIASFALDGVAAADRTDPSRQRYGNQHYGNQLYGNQRYGNQADTCGDHHRQDYENQYHGNQHYGNQHLGNQSYGNQSYGNQRDWRCEGNDSHHDDHQHRHRGRGSDGGAGLPWY
jgi:hypothetical protein